MQTKGSFILTSMKSGFASHVPKTVPVVVEILWKCAAMFPPKSQKRGLASNLLDYKQQIFCTKKKKYRRYQLIAAYIALWA